MKTIIFIMLSLFVCEAHAQAVKDRIHFEIATGTGMRSKGITPMDFSFKAHVDVVRPVCLFVTAEGNRSLYKSNEVRTYFDGESLGGGIGFHILGKKSPLHAFDARLKVLSSIGNADWKRTSYDANIAWYLKGVMFSPVVELGYRHIDSRSTFMNNYDNIYVSLGIRY